MVDVGWGAILLLGLAGVIVLVLAANMFNTMGVLPAIAAAALFALALVALIWISNKLGG